MKEKRKKKKTSVVLKSLKIYLSSAAHLNKKTWLSQIHGVLQRAVLTITF